ncbi:VapE domain-containing protein [[Leptolyngbya] sp. PCC 7376]|uniref:VapE domain-containing protein n=1 Tax=[Leptolyngbya] sp. PCC 7376 TaxID=111781 RepID=UPI0005A27B7B|nr:VapE domain-containing protein [[Leptolyngbya] sp. PCC 7376]
MQTLDKSALQQELEASAISLDIQHNFIPVKGRDEAIPDVDDLAWDYLFYLQVYRKNNGGLRKKWLDNYSHIDAGGWWCQTLDIVNGDYSQWGCFKPNTPRKNKEGKLVKYEHPPKQPTQPFFLEVNRERWEKIARNGMVLLPDLEDIPESSDCFEFWEWVKQHSELPIIITEGAKKTASLLSADYCAVGLSGIWNGAPKQKAGDGTPLEKQLNEQLQALSAEGREIIFCFDNDDKPKTIASVTKAIQSMAELFEAQGCTISVMSWRGLHDEKGIDDIHAAHGSDAVDQLVSNRLTLNDWQKLMSKPILKVGSDEPEKIEAVTSTPIAPVRTYDPSEEKISAKTTTPLTKSHPETETIYGGRKDLNYAQLYQFIQYNLASRLSFDLMRRQVLLDGEIFQMADELRPWFFCEYGETAKEGDIYKTIVYFARQKSFDPVVEDLRRCQREATRISIDNIATRYFGQDPDKCSDDKEKRKAWMYNRCIKMWLISAVARQFQTANRDGDPNYRGCQVDHVLVLQGGQGKGKSTWFGALCGGYFNESMGDIQAKDSLMALHSNWILELAEIDGITSKKAAATLKHFLTTKVDEFRVPYARKSKPHARRSVFCGTVNPSRFLIDDENRRFWVVPVLSSDINVQLIAEERDGIWASAVDAYLAGELWYPTSEEKDILRQIADDFAEIDPWQEPIESYLKLHEYVNSREILQTVCKMDLKDIGKRDEMRVSKILTRLGWTEEKRIRREGQSIRVRYKPRSEQIEMDVETASDTNIYSFLEEKVGNNGKTPDIQSSQMYQPVDQPFGGLVQAGKCTDQNETVPTFLTEVGTSKMPVQQGIEAICTDLPTKKTIPEKYSRAGFKFAENEILQQKTSNRYVMVRELPPIGSRFSSKSYLCEWMEPLSSDPEPTEWIQQSDLREID